MQLHAEQSSAAATLRSKGRGVPSVSTRTSTRHDYGIILVGIIRQTMAASEMRIRNFDGPRSVVVVLAVAASRWRMR
jgi:hypothetical protein